MIEGKSETRASSYHGSGLTDSLALHNRSAMTILPSASVLTTRTLTPALDVMTSSET